MRWLEILSTGVDDLLILLMCFHFFKRTHKKLCEMSWGMRPGRLSKLAGLIIIRSCERYSASDVDLHHVVYVLKEHETTKAWVQTGCKQQTDFKYVQMMAATYINLSPLYSRVVGLRIVTRCHNTYIINHNQLPEKGGRKPAPSPNLFVSAEKCRGSVCHDRSYHPKRPLTIPYEQKPKPSAAPLEDFSLLCNPSPPSPQYYFSSPCKLSCSEPQRTLISVELRSSSIFLHLHHVFRDFPSFTFVFFKCFSCRSSTFLRFPPP